jgi:hypothetical protein
LQEISRAANASRRRDQVEQPLRGVVVEGEPLERQPRPAPAFTAGQLVVKRVAAGIEHPPRAQQGAAGAEHHHPVHRLADPPRDREHREQFALRPPRAVVGQQPVGLVDEGRPDRFAVGAAAAPPAVEVGERLLPRALEPRREPVEARTRQAARGEHARGIVVERILRRFRADHAHGERPGGADGRPCSGNARR